MLLTNAIENHNQKVSEHILDVMEAVEYTQSIHKNSEQIWTPSFPGSNNLPDYACDSVGCLNYHNSRQRISPVPSPPLTLGLLLQQHTSIKREQIVGTSKAKGWDT